jgi:transposase
MQGRESMKTISVYFGIDVSKRTLHLATHRRFLGQFDNTVSGHRQLIQRLQREASQGRMHVILEASGGYERAICEALQDAGLLVTVVQAGCVRHFARSLRVLAKTDEIDAKVIAGYGEAVRPQPTPKTPQNVRALRALVDRREQVVADRVREQNRLEKCADPTMAEHIQEHVVHLETLEQQLDEQIAELLQSDAEFSQKQAAMTQSKGVGDGTATTLLTHLPELGTLRRGQVAALAGLAPHPQESGTWKGRRRIYGGRAAVRKAMYMAARSAARWCPVISQFYERLRAAGKSYNQALIACARKMLIRLNTIMKRFQSQNPALLGHKTT